MVKEFKKMIIDLMLLDEENAKALLEQFASINEIDVESKEYKSILKYIENYER
jgi:hypothetical protein